MIAATVEPPSCQQQGCTRPATARYVWPGEGWQFACTEHVSQARCIVGTLGYFFLVEPLNQSEPFQCDR
jgi:hypothetical protein